MNLQNKIVLLRVLSVGWVAALPWAGVNAQAQTFPSKPLRWVVPAPAGSSVDVAARLIGEGLRERVNQAVVIENRPGAGGTIAAAEVARATADGYSLFVGFNGPLATAPFLFKNLPYKPLEHFAPVIATVSQPHVLAVHAGLPVRTLAQFVTEVKSMPGKYNYASVGNASASHLAMELFKAQAGLAITHVPYGGGPPATQALMAGDAQALFTAYINIKELAAVGKLRVLGLAQASRSVSLPELPTFAEQGVRGVDAPLFNAMVAPAATSKAIVMQLNREIAAVLAQAPLRGRLAAGGMDVIGGSPEQLATLMRTEAQRWEPLIRRLELRLD